jgi:hypothetical protein
MTPKKQEKYIYFLAALLLLLLTFSQSLQAQSAGMLQGLITAPYDNSIELGTVQIKSSGGITTTADKTGYYHIAVHLADTVRFYYRQRLVDAYICSALQSPLNYNVTIVMDESAAAHELATVKVYGKSYREDSLARRRRYQNLYDYKNPKLSMGDNKWSSFAEVMGEKMQLNTADKKLSLMDVRSLANVFSFKKKKQRKRDQRFALEVEQMSYIRHRVSKNLVEKYGQIHNEDSLNVFIQRYSPGYEALKKMSDFELFQDIITQAKLFKQGLPANRK